jgi:hypothetical protein
MKIQQFIKSLNNTEIGKGGTHECYVLVSKKVKNIENIFDPANLQPTFINLKNGGILDSVHIKSGREFRINGLGDFYRNNNVNAGDEIVFERQDNGTKAEFFINLNTKENTIVFQKNRRGFEVLNSDRLDLLMSANRYQDKVSYNGSSGLFVIEFKESAKKRSDSPDETDFFTITFNGKEILKDLKSNEYLELSNSILRKVVVWQELQFLLPDIIINEKEVEQRKEQIKKIIEKTIENNGYVVGSSVKGNITFLTKNIKDIVPKTSDGSWLYKESFSYEIVYRKGFIQLKFVISPGNEQNRKVLREIAKNIPGGQKAKGKDWIVNYIYTIKTNIYSYSSAQDGNIKKLIDKILNENKTQIEFFENEVLNLKDKFQY